MILVRYVSGVIGEVIVQLANPTNDDYDLFQRVIHGAETANKATGK
jgi:hypothetical protein